MTKKTWANICVRMRKTQSTTRRKNENFYMKLKLSCSDWFLDSTPSFYSNFEWINFTFLINFQYWFLYFKIKMFSGDLENANAFWWSRDVLAFKIWILMELNCIKLFTGCIFINYWMFKILRMYFFINSWMFKILRMYFFNYWIFKILRMYKNLSMVS